MQKFLKVNKQLELSSYAIGGLLQMGRLHIQKRQSNHQDASSNIPLHHSLKNEGRGA
jgi:hypothetical protein